jgi:hypothetical protein
MTATYDRMVEEQEAREQCLRDEDTAAFRAKNEDQVIAAYEELGRIQQEEAKMRRAMVVYDLGTRMWEALRTSGGDGPVTASAVLHSGDRQYFTEHGLQLMMGAVGITKEQLVASNARFVVTVEDDNKGPGSSGMLFLRVRFAPASTGQT